MFADQLLTASGATGAIFAPAKEYFLIVSSGSVLLFIMMAVMFAFNAQGDTTTLTKLFAFSTGINIVLDPALIFGYGPFPELGIQGAAIATLVSQSAFLIVAIYILSRPTRSIRFRFSNLNVRMESVKRVLRIGFPAALTQVIFPIGLAVVTYIAALGFDEAGSIAMSLGMRIEFFAYLPAAGFGFGAMAMMGQNIGAGNLERTREAFRKAAAYAFLGAAGLGVFAALFAGPLIELFSEDVVVTEYTFGYLYTVAFSYGFLALLMVTANAFQSVDRSWPGFWIFLLRVAVITVPLAWYLTQVQGCNIYGIWGAVIAGNVLAAIAGLIWIRRTLRSLKPTTEV